MTEYYRQVLKSMVCQMSQMLSELTALSRRAHDIHGSWSVGVHFTRLVSNVTVVAMKISTCISFSHYSLKKIELTQNIYVNKY